MKVKVQEDMTKEMNRRKAWEMRVERKGEQYARCKNNQTKDDKEAERGQVQKNRVRYKGRKLHPEETVTTDFGGSRCKKRITHDEAELSNQFNFEKRLIGIMLATRIPHCRDTV